MSDVNRAAAPTPNPELTAGPGGVGTPTPEPGPTPTPPEPLRPVADLLGTPTPQPGAGTEPPGGNEPPVGGTPEPAPGAPSAPAPAEPAAEEASRADAKSRINRLTSEKWEERRAREAAESRARVAEEALAELARFAQQPPAAPQVGPDGQPTPPAPQPRVPTQPSPRMFTEAELRAESARLAQQSEFNRSIDAEVISGRKVHPDYDASISELKKVTGPVIPQGFVEAAMATGKGGEVFYHLGQDIAEADRILSLPPAAQGVALAQFAAKINPTFEIPVASRAPAPIRPRVGGAARVEASLEEVDMGEFIRRRNEQESAAKAASRR